MSKTKVAVLASDLHLAAKPPVFRSRENDWIATQKGYLNQVGVLTRSSREWENSCSTVITCIGGDVFHAHGAEPSAISLALTDLPGTNIYAVPGNHDLPNHRYEEVGKSAYGSLVAAAKIVDLCSCRPIEVGNVRLWGYTCGQESQIETDGPKPNDLFLDVAVVHSYIWTKGLEYPGASEESHLGKWGHRLRNFDAVLMGDNHMPVDWNLDRKKEGPAIFNPGGFTVRKSDERNHRPRVGILYSDGTIEPHYLDISKDVYLDVSPDSPDAEILKRIDLEDFENVKEELLRLGDSSLDVAETLRRTAESPNVSVGAKNLVLKALDASANVRAHS